MPAVRRTRLNEFIWRNHRRLYKATAGKIGGSIGGNPVLLLTTTGRKSGEPRTVALAHLAASEKWVVIASFAGQPRHPGWWLNLLENPVGKVQKGTTITDVRARETEGEERERLWKAICEQEQGFADYQSWTERRIPVVVLDPIEKDSV
jgi:deazaflavin-dependent oxidoreductase (nitroreductase family)